MTNHRKSQALLTSASLFLLGGCALAMMIWMIASDPLLSNVLWPHDIQEAVVAALGGRIERSSATGVYVTQLGLTSVAWRVIAGLFVASVFGVGARKFRHRKAEAVAARAKTADGWFGLSLEFASSNAMPGFFAVVWLLVWYLAPLIGGSVLVLFVVNVTPYCLAMILAGVLNQVVSNAGRSLHPETPGTEVRSGRCELLVVIVAMLAWEMSSFWMNERLYAGLLVPHGDSAMYEEHLWNVWHGKGFRSYLDQGLFLGEHIQVIHLLLLPLHMLCPSYLTMEFCASFSLAICVIPIFSMARRHSGSPRAAMWLSLAWLMFFPMHYLDIAIDIKTLRPSCYGLPFLFWGIDFAERRKLARSSVCLLIALSTQEDFSLIVGSIGLVLFLREWIDHRRTSWFPSAQSKWSMGVLLFSVAYLLLAVLLVIPAFRGGGHVHYSRYFGDLGSSPGDLVRTAISDPGKVVAVLCSFRTLIYLIVLTVPLGGLVWRRPIYLLAGVPTFVMLSMIQLGNSSGVSEGTTDVAAMSQLPPVPYHHFHAPLLPVLLWAAAAGLSGTRPRMNFFAIRVSREHSVLFDPVQSIKRVQDCGRRARFAFLCSLLTAVTGSMMPMGATFWSDESPYGRRQMYVPGPRAAAFEKVLALIPLDSRVASTDYVHTRLTHFERSYDYSDYLRAVNGYQRGVPADTDYIVIDTSHPYSRVRSPADVRELLVEPEKWDVLPDETNGLFIVLKRRR